MLMKMRSKMQRTNNQKGFTLVELMVVVVIIGILVAIAIPVYNNVTAKANRSAVEANLRTIDSAIMQYGAVNDQASPGKTNIEGTYVKVWPKGPDGVTYDVGSGAATATKGTNTGSWFGAVLQPGGRFSWLVLDADSSLVVEALASTPEAKASATMSV